MMSTRALLYSALGALLLAALPSGAQLFLVDSADAARAAGDLAAEAEAASFRSPENDYAAEQEMQSYVDEIAILADRMEADISAGRGVSETRRAYRRLRTLRLQAIELAMAGKIELDPVDIQAFEAAMDRLDAYHRRIR